MGPQLKSKQSRTSRAINNADDGVEEVVDCMI